MKSGNRTCKTLSQDGMISCQSIKKMQKRSQKLQSVQGQKKQWQKDFGAGESEADKE